MVKLWHSEILMCNLASDVVVLAGGSCSDLPDMASMTTTGLVILLDQRPPFRGVWLLLN